MPQPQVFWQTEDPSNLLGSNGDVCFQTQSNSSLIAFKKSSGSWSRIGSITDTIPSTNATIKVASVTLTDAQIKTLPTTPVTILAAQGVRTMIQPIFAIMAIDLRSDGTGYTNIAATSGTDGPSLQIQYGESHHRIALAQIRNTTNGTADLTAFLQFTFDIAVAKLPMWFFFYLTDFATSADIDPQGNYENCSIQIGGYNRSGGNWTGGNSNNALRIWLYYIVQDMAVAS